VRVWFSYRKETPDAFTDARPDLLPSIRVRSELHLLPLRLRTEGKGDISWPHRVLAGHLGLTVVYDRPESMTHLQQSRLDEWAVSLDEALAASCDNLKEISGNTFEQPRPGVWISPWRDNYDAARLAIPEVLRQYDVQGELVAAVPNRDVLILTGSEDEAGLTFLLNAVEECMAKPRPLSAIPVLLDGDTWLPFQPDPKSPLFERFRLPYVKSVGDDYTEQAELLNALHKKTGEDLFVAAYNAVKRGEMVISYCVWSEGVDTLLPRTDEVFFFRQGTDQKGEIVMTAEWSKVAQVVGELMEPCGLYPERYRVRAFPTPEQFASMGGS
jgi:hypothetical protein